MNIVKNETAVRKRRLRYKNVKYFKSNLPRYHTTSRAQPLFPLRKFMTDEVSKSSFDAPSYSSIFQVLPSLSESTVDSSGSNFEELVKKLRIESNLTTNDSCVHRDKITSSTHDRQSSESTTCMLNDTNNSRLSKTTATVASLDDNSLLSLELTSGNHNLDVESSRKRNKTLWTPGKIKITPRNRTSSSSTTSSRTKTPLHLRNRTNSSSISTSTSGKGKFLNESDCGRYILAITEGRGQARGEVGIAAVDPRRPHLILCQISDNQRYIHTLTKINIFNFIEIIIPNTFIEGSSPTKLYTDIRDHFPSVTLTSVQRRHFNEAVGLELISQYGSPESGSIMVLVRDKFYALSAAAALIKYVEYTQNILFASQSVRVEYQGTEDTMIIDLETANRLELVVSKISTESSHKNTLFGVLKHCHTKGGIRLLRANILQPPCSRAKIEARLDCVSELIQKPLIFFALEAAVSNFSNVENLLSLCMHEPLQDGVKAAEFQLKYVLLLKTVLELLPALTSALEDTTSEYFCRVRENLEDVRLKIILNRILDTVAENARTVKGSVAAHLHACFAIKTGINGLLDIAKKTYCEIVQEIWDHIDFLREKYSLPLRMSFSAQRGFHIQYTLLPSQKNQDESHLPNEFILIHKSKSTFFFYTAELVALDQRSQQVLNEVKLITNVVLFELLNDIRQHIGGVVALCEYIAELDVIISFAHVGSGQNYVRPEFGNVLNVIESRHPILDVIHEGKIVPNDIFAEKDRNCIILTGPNQSGKSIYIGQVALLQIMAQVGCFVPARRATFRMTDRMFSRIGFDDSIETNASTLIVEMRDIEYIRQNITSNSLVIIDELCRGTSVEEGTSLAFTVCEELLDSDAYIFLTTHYMFLTKLEELYFNVLNCHFETELMDMSTGKFSLKFTHRKLPGVTEAEQYGLQVAGTTAFPRDVLTTAKNIAQKLLKERKPLPEVNGLSTKYRTFQELKKELSIKGSQGCQDEVSAIIVCLKAVLGNLDSTIHGRDYNDDSTCSKVEWNLNNLQVFDYPPSSTTMMETISLNTDKNCIKASEREIVSDCQYKSEKAERGYVLSNVISNNRRLGFASSVNTFSKHSKNRIRLLSLSMKIKRKYRHFMIRRVYYQFFKDQFRKKKISSEKPFFIQPMPDAYNTSIFNI